MGYGAPFGLCGMSYREAEQAFREISGIRDGEPIFRESFEVREAKRLKKEEQKRICQENVEKTGIKFQAVSILGREVDRLEKIKLVLRLKGQIYDDFYETDSGYSRKSSILSINPNLITRLKEFELKDKEFIKFDYCVFCGENQGKVYETVLRLHDRKLHPAMWTSNKFHHFNLNQMDCGHKYLHLFY